MKQYSDDDIEVLGGNPMPRRRKISIWWLVAAGIVAAVVVITAVFSLARPSYDNQAAASDEAVMSESFDPYGTESVAGDFTTPETEVPGDTVPALPREFTDSINDVVFTVVSLEGCRAEVSFAQPDSADRDILAAVLAADIRADNGRIVCEFIHQGQQLSRGVRKAGFCYVSPEGNITIGMGEGQTFKESAFNEGGTFFRQYPLVIDGEMQSNSLKGKAVRRALAFLHGKPTIVVSKDRESIYDFSQALADYGFSHALYLPGGKNFIKLLTDSSDLYYAPEYGDASYINYMIFKH